MTKKLDRIILLTGALLLSVLSVCAAITSTSQDLDEFSFGKGLKMNGSLTTGNTFYSGSDSLVNREPYVFDLSGNLNINLWGIAMPFSFNYSNTNRSYTQPFNRFKLDPRYKWVHLLVGYNTLELSKYTLSDHDFCGVGVELTPGQWTIAGMYGRLRKAIEYNPLKDNIASVSYKRMGYAGKVGYKADFGGEYAVTLFHGWDDESSLSDPVPDDCVITPQKNTAASVTVSQKIFKKFFIRAEYAFTIYNSNLMAGEGETEEGVSALERIMGKRTSERFMDAVSGGLGWQDRIWGVSFNYERVAPGYTTLGGYYFTNDVETFSLSPNVRLLKGKLSLSGNVGLQRNNLDGNRAQDTRNVVCSFNANFAPDEHWNTSLAFSNYNMYTRVKPQAYPYYTNDLDSLNFYQVSRSVNASCGYNWQGENTSNAVSLATSYQCANQLSEEELTMYSDYFSGNLAYSRQISPIKLGWSTFIMANYCDATGTESLYYGPGAAVSKSFLQGKLGTSLSASYNVNEVAGYPRRSLLNTSLGASYSVDGREKKLGSHTFSLSSGYTRHFGAGYGGSNNYEFLTSLKYTIAF